MLSVLLALAAALPAFALGSGPVVSAPCGSLEGERLDGVDRFLGVPFAQPPLNSLRWKSPAQLQPWTGVREAKVNGNDCLATTDYIKVQNKSEDCLYLNVFRPANATQTSKLPVMHFFYGGSWEEGGASFPIYDGGSLVLKGDVIVVVSNYRLGPFGFLGSKDLAEDAEDGSTGNFGIQDQRMAMLWVVNNIEAFGGDPKNVMIFGQSAGSGSVASHCVMPRSKGLFQKAGLESGPPSDWSSKNLTDANNHYLRILSAVGCANGATPAARVACMRALPAETILANEEDTPGLLSWAPTVDGVELKDEPQHLWEKGALNPVEAILIGTVRDEGTEFMTIPADISAANYSAWLRTVYGPSWGAKVEALYPASAYESPFFAAAMIFTDSLMACPSRRAATWATKNRIPTYLFHFVHVPFALHLAKPDYGCAHSAEVPFVFHFAPLLWGTGESALSYKMVDYWTQFARTGSPNSHATPVQWPQFDPSSGAFMNLNLTISAGTHLKDTECAFWDSVYAKGCVVNNCPCSCPGF